MIFKTDGSDFESLLRPETQLIFVESPGSLLYEMLDLPAICHIAHQREFLLQWIIHEDLGISIIR